MTTKKRWPGYTPEAQAYEEATRPAVSAPTPGPWTVLKQPGGIGGAHSDLRGEGLKFIAHLYEVSDANARLIAAAPRMLDWLKAYMCKGGDPTASAASAMAILRDVEGE